MNSKTTESIGTTEIPEIIFSDIAYYDFLYLCTFKKPILLV